MKNTFHQKFRTYGSDIQPFLPGPTLQTLKYNFSICVPLQFSTVAKLVLSTLTVLKRIYMANYITLKIVKACENANERTYSTTFG